MIAKTVFLLCALTSLLCAILLLSAYARRSVRLLLWSGLCFACFFLSNVTLFFDRFIWPTTDLSLIHMGLTLIGLVLMIHGLVRET
jgi:hypothetical protein